MDERFDLVAQREAERRYPSEGGDEKVLGTAHLMECVRTAFVAGALWREAESAARQDDAYSAGWNTALDRHYTAHDHELDEAYAQGWYAAINYERVVLSRMGDAGVPWTREDLPTGGK